MNISKLAVGMACLNKMTGGLNGHVSKSSAFLHLRNLS